MAKPVVNAVYYPSWKMYKGKPPSSLRLQSVTHVLYAFVRVNIDGTLRLLDEWGDLRKEVDGETGCLAAFVKLKRQHPHIKTVVSVGGGSGSAEFPVLAANPTARATFAQSAREFCDKYQFNGIDIDWEHPTTAEQGSNFLQLLHDVRKCLPSPQYLLMTALPTGTYCLKNIDLKSAAHYLDFLNLMGYDFTRGWTEVAGHHAQLHAPKDSLLHLVKPDNKKSCAQGVDYVLGTGFPSQKVLLGIPAYARYFPKATNIGRSSHKSAGEVDYCDMPQHWLQNADVDMELGAAAFVDKEKGFASFDVPKSVAMKASYANAMKLGGLFYWTGLGDRDGAESLVDAGYRELMRRDASC
ncbi:hypothetical protein NLU13_4632 [Sarocladium strictum]|uniref:chitinase n=1 Tax=Sarocladium strictum TaxID=5046 RepID=A0AA39GJ86_SARSR|nr:hypothetical protein NLU13_4632 [Sarocladium strictum]